MQVSSIPVTSSNPQVSSTSSAAMEVEHFQLSTQAAKPKKLTKSKSKKLTSGVSQKAPVVISTSQSEGSVKEVSGEGEGWTSKKPPE